MPPGSGLQARPRAPHSPARSGTASRTASVIGRGSKDNVTVQETFVNKSVTNFAARKMISLRAKSAARNAVQNDVEPPSLKFPRAEADSARKSDPALSGFVVLCGADATVE